MIVSGKYTVKDLLPYINWAYFFHAWNLTENSAQNKLRDDALQLAEEIDEHCFVNTLFGLWRAKSKGDDVVLENNHVFHFLRRQTAADSFCPCLADFIDEQLFRSEMEFPVSSTIGTFATSVCCAQNSDRDSYAALLKQTLCDRLAEAGAEKLHEHIRKDVWGYAKNEHLKIEELFSEKFQGIRPAVGYPSLPDQSIIFEINEVMNLQQAGITLTENGAMYPHASVVGFLFGRKEAEYFSVGKIDEEQLRDYARRKGMPEGELKKFLQTYVQKGGEK